MPGRALATCLAVLAVTATPAAAITPSALERRLARADLYVERGTAPDLSARERRRLRAELADQDGRVKLAVVEPAAAQAAGGVERYANEVAKYARGRDRTIGAGLFVLAGLDAHFVVAPSISDSAVVEDYKGRVAGVDDTFVELRAAAAAVRRLDPGPAPDRQEPRGTDAPGALQGIEDAAGDVAGVAKGVLITIAATVVGVALLLVGVFAVRAARRRRASERAEDLATDDSRRALLALGEAIRALDLDVSMPGADPDGVAAYHAAVERYDRARAVLDREDPDAFELGRADTDVAEGLRHMETARERLAR